MRKILIATDGSPAALQAVELGLELAEEQHAQPTFVHVAPAADVLPVTGFAMAGPVSVPHELAEADRSSLDEAVLIAEMRGIDAQTKLLAGDPAQRDRRLRGRDRRRPDRGRLARPWHDRRRAARKRLAQASP